MSWSGAVGDSLSDLMMSQLLSVSGVLSRIALRLGFAEPIVSMHRYHGSCNFAAEFVLRDLFR